LNLSYAKVCGEFVEYDPIIFKNSTRGIYTNGTYVWTTKSITGADEVHKYYPKLLRMNYWGDPTVLDLFALRNELKKLEAEK